MVKEEEEERVVELRLSRNGLAGAVPLFPLLCRMDRLRHVDLASSIFQNIRPPENERRIGVRDDEPSIIDLVGCVDQSINRPID